jgi:hypothetical protein
MLATVGRSPMKTKVEAETLTLKIELPLGDVYALRLLARRRRLSLDEIVSRLIRNTHVLVNAENEGTGVD